MGQLVDHWSARCVYCIRDDALAISPRIQAAPQETAAEPCGAQWDDDGDTSGAEAAAHLAADLGYAGAFVQPALKREQAAALYGRPPIGATCTH